MNKKINIEDAKIKTATITIKAVSVDKRQMTLAVFRQIQVEDIIDTKTYQLRGLPWGLVNYYNKDDLYGIDKSDNPIHVLWQKGSEFRRCVLINRNDLWHYDTKYPLFYNTRKDYAYIRKAYREKNWKNLVNPQCLILMEEYCHKTLTTGIPLPSLKLKSPTYFLDKEEYDQFDIFLQELANAIGLVVSEAYKIYKETDLIPYNNLMNQLRQLEQLYIAV